jgi:seryl-tRNA synthetase
VIDLKWIEKPQAEGGGQEMYRENLIARGADLSVFDKILTLAKERRLLIHQSETKKAEQKKLSEEIPKLKKAGQDTAALQAELSEFAAEVKKLEERALLVDRQVQELLMSLPNKLDASVPRGQSASDNKLIKSVGEPKKFSFKAKDHVELGESLGILDFERAGKVTGARFSFLCGPAARLERALVQFFMDLHNDQHGYREIIPPYIVNSKSYVGTGQFPKFKEDVFHLADTDYHLISTAEVPVTNLFADEILSEAQLPARFCAFSPCFRSEAGAAGRDTRGLIRQHQFHKVELMIFARPAESYEWHEKLTAHAEKCLELLELPYRRMQLCSGDIGFGAAKCYDLEVWLPSSETYREISSCSNFEDFQARRANIRFRPEGGGKPKFVHTLNGSGLAVGRTLLAVLENYQREDGSIRVPEVLVRYMGTKEIRC